MLHLAELVLKGEYRDDELDTITTMILDNLKQVQPELEATKLITAEQFNGKMKAWRETTSTLPSSGRHLGHYKSLFTPPPIGSNEDEAETWVAMQKLIKRCYIQVVNYCIKHEYVLERWKNVTNMMIYKEAGNIKIHRLRIIYLYKADMSLMWGEHCRRAMRQAVDARSLHQGQFGGLPGRDCTSVCFMEELRFEYATLTRFPMAHFDNDAAACYDRIVVALASLCGRKRCINREVIFVHAKTLQEARFTLKTAKGISDTWYLHCVRFPIHGTGQGSTNSPTIWCFILSELFECHTKEAHGILFESPDGNLFVQMSIVGFVDDSTGITGGNVSTTYNKLKQMMIEDAQLWHDLLWASGGKLELKKCGFHIFNHDFRPDGRSFMNYRVPGTVELQDSDNRTVSIHKKGIFTSRKNLGHFKAPSGNCKVQYEATLATATKIANDIVAFGGTRNDMRMLVKFH